MKPWLILPSARERPLNLDFVLGNSTLSSYQRGCSKHHQFISHFVTQTQRSKVTQFQFFDFPRQKVSRTRPKSRRAINRFDYPKWKCERNSFHYQINLGRHWISQSEVVFRWIFPLIEAQQWKTLQKSCMGGRVGFPGKDSSQGLPERNPTFGWQIVRRTSAKVAWVSGQQCTETTSSRGHCQA